MKLNELYGLRRSEEYNEFKKLIQPSLEKNSAEEKEEAFRLFSQYLKNRGFVPLGAGSGGLVFRHPGLSYCIKVFSRDPAYMDFVHIVQSDPTNPYFPRFKGRFMQLDKDNFVVRMELLNRINIQLWNLISSSVHLVKVNHEIHYSEKIEQMKQKFPGFIETLQLLRDKNPGHYLDWQDSNFMLRSDGHIVIIDPYFVDQGFN